MKNGRRKSLPRPHCFSQFTAQLLSAALLASEERQSGRPFDVIAAGSNGGCGSSSEFFLTDGVALLNFKVIRGFDDAITGRPVLFSILDRFISPAAKARFEKAARSASVTTNQTLPSEEALVARAREGNRNAFGELARRHSNGVYGISYKILKNREDAEDSRQNAFFKAYRRIRQFEGKSQFSTWLTRIAINEALMILRKRRKGEIVEGAGVKRNDEDSGKNQNLSSFRADPERQYLAKELATKAFDALNPEIKSTFILHKAEGRTGQEVAKMLDITAETVKSRVFRARVRMRRRILDLVGVESISFQN